MSKWFSVAIWTDEDDQGRDRHETRDAAAFEQCVAGVGWDCQEDTGRAMNVVSHSGEMRLLAVEMEHVELNQIGNLVSHLYEKVHSRRWSKRSEECAGF